MWQILLVALAISFGVSVANRRRRWVWFAWIPAAAIAGGIIVFVTWLMSGTSTSGPGAIGAGIVMLVSCLGLAGGGTVLWLLWRWRPIGDAAASAHPWRVAVALLGWLVILAAACAGIYAI